MSGANLVSVERLLAMRDALLRFREAASGIAPRMALRVERAQATLARKRRSLERAISEYEEETETTENDHRGQSSGLTLQDAQDALDEIVEAERKLAEAFDRYQAAVPLWRHALDRLMPAAAAFLAQKHSDAVDYMRLMSTGVDGSSQANLPPEVKSSGDFQRQRAIGASPAPALPDGPTSIDSGYLPDLPEGLVWVPLAKIDPSEVPAGLEFKKGVTYDQMRDGLLRLWGELIPLVGSVHHGRAACEAFDEQHGRIDRRGFVHRLSLAHLWDQFFHRDNRIRISVNPDTGRWSITNGRHRILVARDLGWKYVPAVLEK
jgi:hypothetical protein